MSPVSHRTYQGISLCVQQSGVLLWVCQPVHRHFPLVLHSNNSMFCAELPRGANTQSTIYILFWWFLRELFPLFSEGSDVYCFVFIFQHWECRLFFTVYQYALVSSYIWIFVEAIYIHMVIFVAVLTEKTRVLWYMVFGWSKFSIPLISFSTVNTSFRVVFLFSQFLANLLTREIMKLAEIISRLHENTRNGIYEYDENSFLDDKVCLQTCEHKKEIVK